MAIKPQNSALREDSRRLRTCMQNARFFAFPLIVLSVFSLAVMGSKQSTSKPITKEEADAAIKAWMGAFVGLSDADSAEAFITKFYAYGSVETMFKPTTAASSTQKADAVAYFTKQGPMMALATGPPAYDVKTFINDPSGNGFAYGQWTLSLKAVPPPVKEKLDMAKLGLNADGTSLTFDYTLGFTRVGGAIKIFLHHNVWTPTPQ